MGGGGSDSSEEEDDGIFRKMMPFNLKTSGRQIFYSELKPSRFVKKLRRYLESRDIVAELHDKRWLLTFTVEDEDEDTEFEAKEVPFDFC